MEVTFSQTDKVLILNFHYKNGVLGIKNKLIKYGFYPDRKIQPKEGYKLEIWSSENKILYTFKFQLPTKIYVDHSKNDTLEGGIIVLNETDFALILPYFDNAKVIKIYNPRGYKIITYALWTEKLSPKKLSYLLFSLFLLLILLIKKIKKRV